MPPKDTAYIGKLASVDFRPNQRVASHIFILGIARSGTTLLFNLLTQSQNFNYTSYYHLVNYDELLFNHVNGLETERKAELTAYLQERMSNRGIDTIGASADSPEEYGFLLRRAPSPTYRQYKGPKVRRDARQFLLNDWNRPKFIELCRKVQHISAEDRPLLLKNPGDFANVAYVQRHFPYAKFVFIHRNPWAIMNSQMRLVNSMYAEPNAYYALLLDGYKKIANSPVRRRVWQWLQGSPNGRLPKTIVRQLTIAGIETFWAEMGELAPENHIHIRYEDLCTDPTATLDQIFAFLGITPTQQPNTATIKPRQHPLLPAIEAIRDKSSERIQPYVTHFDYTPEVPPFAKVEPL